jgi:hypothetical protein
MCKYDGDVVLCGFMWKVEGGGGRGHLWEAMKIATHVVLLLTLKKAPHQQLFGFIHLSVISSSFILTSL